MISVQIVQNMEDIDMRNSYLRAYASGRNTPVTCGPRELQGSMFGDLFMRDNGKSVPAFSFIVFPEGDTFVLSVKDERGAEILRKVTHK